MQSYSTIMAAIQIIFWKLKHCEIYLAVFCNNMGYYWPLFLYFRLFDTVKSKQMHIKVCWWLDSNRRPSLLEATALLTEPQPLPVFLTVFSSNWSDLSDCDTIVNFCPDIMSSNPANAFAFTNCFKMINPSHLVLWQNQITNTYVCI